MSYKRIFIGPHEIAGYYANLANGFREIGVECDYITYTPHPFGYGGETRTPALLRLARFFNRFRGDSNRSFIERCLVALPGNVFSTVWAVFAVFKYDVFIFGFGHSLIPIKNFDLKILRLLRKTVISNLAHGADARPPYVDGAYQSSDGMECPAIGDINSWTESSAARVRRVQNYSSFVIGAPLSTTHFSNKSMINSFAFGLPFCPANHRDTSIVGSRASSSNNSTYAIRILHSPSHPAAKGSPLILQAIKNLKDKGHAVELILLHGKPHAEVMDEIQRCDFVVDQLYSDTPMAGFATEAAWFGKPAVVGGYGFEYLKTFVPDGMWPPSKTCHPDEIEQAIEDLIVHREERLRLGAEARKFVGEKWNAAEVARRYMRLIEGDISDAWWLDPNSITYLEGAGQPEERTKDNIRQLVEQFGVKSLQLTHRPKLERAFLEFADVKNTN